MPPWGPTNSAAPPRRAQGVEVAHKYAEPCSVEVSIRNAGMASLTFHIVTLRKKGPDFAALALGLDPGPTPDSGALMSPGPSAVKPGFSQVGTQVARLLEALQEVRAPRGEPHAARTSHARRAPACLTSNPEQACLCDSAVCARAHRT